MSGPWTKAEKAIVKEARKKGESATAIAMKLRGRSRNAVIALAHREGYDTPAPQGWKPGVRKSQANRPMTTGPVMTKPLPPPPAAPPPPVLATMRSVPIEELKQHECRFPVGGSGSRHHFCGAPAEKDSAWCPHHHERVYRKERGAAA